MKEDFSRYGRERSSGTTLEEEWDTQSFQALSQSFGVFTWSQSLKPS